MIIKLYGTEVTNPEILANIRNLTNLVNHYKHCQRVEFSYHDNYIIIDGKCYNGVNKKIFYNITRGIKFSKEDAPEFIDWQKRKLR